jgi:hypothetical protein
MDARLGSAKKRKEKKNVKSIRIFPVLVSVRG